MKTMKKAITKLTLISLLATAMGTNIFAEETVTELSEQKVTKHFVMAEGLEIPTETFSFTATSETADAPDLTIENISYGKTDNKGALSEGVYTLDKDVDITFGTFPHAGLYEYMVKETSGSAEGVTYDSTSYHLRVYVVNDENGQLSIQNLTAEADDGKQDSLSFTNTYRQTGSLTITKNTVGDLADKTKDFTFTITFIKSGTESSGITSYTGKIENEAIECAIGEVTSFELHDGESIVFKELPVGTRYVVTEAGAEDGYIPSVSVIENGVQTVDSKNGTEKNALSTAENSSGNLVGEKENSVTFINTYPETPVTGVIMKHLPFLLLIVLPMLTLFLMMAVKVCRKHSGKH